MGKISCQKIWRKTFKLSYFYSRGVLDLQLCLGRETVLHRPGQMFSTPRLSYCPLLVDNTIDSLTVISFQDRLENYKSKPAEVLGALQITFAVIIIIAQVVITAIQAQGYEGFVGFWAPVIVSCSDTKLLILSILPVVCHVVEATLKFQDFLNKLILLISVHSCWSIWNTVFEVQVKMHSKYSGSLLQKNNVQY